MAPVKGFCDLLSSRDAAPKYALTSFLVAALLLSSAHTAASTTYQSELFSGFYASNHHDPQINSAAAVAWVAYLGSSYEIFYDDGSALRQLTADGYLDYAPQLNDLGMTVWVKKRTSADYGIYLYDTATALQISENTGENNDPRINNSNEVVWWGYDGNDFEIFHYDGESVSRLTDNDLDDRHPEINANGQVVWQGFDGNDYEIFLYDGTTTRQLTDNNFDDQLPRIAPDGKVVFTGNDGNDNEIFLYDGLTVTQLTDNTLDDFQPSLNSSIVTWAGYDGNDYEIFRYDNGRTVQLTDDDYDDYSPQVNGSNLIVWWGYAASRSEVFLASGEEISVISHASTWDYDPRINDNGLVIYYGWSWDGYQIYLASPRELTVRIDIKPGGTPNSINNNGFGVIPVAVFGDPALDVHEISVPSLSLDGLTVSAGGQEGTYLAHYEYVDDDPYLDLVVQFDDLKDNFAADAASATLRGSLTSGVAIKGLDSIRIVEPLIVLRQMFQEAPLIARQMIMDDPTLAKDRATRRTARRSARQRTR